MGKIFCLLGKSCSGKDTIFRELKEDCNLNLQPIILYTTRPIRSNEINGKEYNFINEEILNLYDQRGQIIEKRIYHTINGKWSYSTIDDGKFDLEQYNYLVISTLEGYQSFQTYFSSDRVVPLYVHIEDGIRLQRALQREMQQVQPDYDELCRRFLADNKDFRVDKLKSSGISKYYENYDLQECLETIKKDILSFL